MKTQNTVGESTNHNATGEYNRRMRTQSSVSEYSHRNTTEEYGRRMRTQSTVCGSNHRCSTGEYMRRMKKVLQLNVFTAVRLGSVAEECGKLFESIDKYVVYCSNIADIIK